MSRQRGVALVTALLIMALLGILAANLTWDNSLDVRRTMSMIYHDEGTQAAYGAENWVSSLLRQDYAESTSDHLGEIWAQEFPVLPIESESIQGALTGELVDLQGRFNVNNLVGSDGEVDPDALAQFQRLLIALEIDPRLAGVTADWLDPDQEAGFPDGAEDAMYTGRLPPYLAANRQIATPTELLAIEGMDRETWQKLEPHVTALPGRTGINVNTATGPVLQSLDESLSAADAEGLMIERENGGFPDYLNRFQTIVTPEVLETLEESSSYFRLKVVVQIATVRVTYFSVLYRDVGGTGAVVPILRSFGTI